METPINPYLLAQYIIEKPDTKKEFNFLDADPILTQLPAKLMAYTIEIFSDKQGFLKMLEEDHPNKLLQRLAQRADELCPGRTYSDLLYKQVTVYQVFTSATKAMFKAVLNRPEINSFSFQDFASLASMMNDLRKSSTL